MQSIAELGQRVWEQSDKMANWRDNDTPIGLAQMIEGEARELTKSIEDDGEAYDVGSEIGDVLYLALKLCHDLGFNPQDLVEMKILRNDMKYTTDSNSSGTYKQGVQRSKAMWQAMGGDKHFYEAHEEYIGAMQHAEEAVAVAHLGMVEAKPNGNGNGNGNGHHHEEVATLPVLYQVRS